MTEKETERAERMLDKAQGIYESHGKVFRIMWVAVAVVVVAAGIAMIVFPGPVSVVVPAGLAMLAAVFGWARRLLLASVEKGVEAKHRVEDTSRKAKILGVAALVLLAGAGAVAAYFWYTA